MHRDVSVCVEQYQDIAGKEGAVLFMFNFPKSLVVNPRGRVDLLPSPSPCHSNHFLCIYLNVTVSAVAVLPSWRAKLWFIVIVSICTSQQLAFFMGHGVSLWVTAVLRVS